jgi:hypothetical protein
MSIPTNSEIDEILAQMSVDDRELLNEILAEDEDTPASEGVAIVRQNWTVQNLVDKKIHKTTMLIAKLKNDPMYFKFKKFFKLSRFWRAKIRQKYYGIARGIVMAQGGLKSKDVAKVVHERFGNPAGPNPMQNQIKR